MKLKYLFSLALVFILFFPVTSFSQETAPFEVVAVPELPPSGRYGGGIEGGMAPLGYVEIHGVSAGKFNPEYWSKNQLHWVRESRYPLLAPRMGGVFRNIYAPSAVEEGNGWRFFYAAWDGIESGTDRVYSVTTPDFIDFNDRHTVINNGEFIHVSNVNVQKMDDGSMHMYTTAAPDRNRTNSPAYFFSPDGKTWNGSPEPYAATHNDEVIIEGYDTRGDKQNLNGANVLLYDKGIFRTYFTNWRDPGKMYWSESKDPKRLKFGGVSLETFYAINDVKKFSAQDKDWYVAAFHKKGDASPDQKEVNKLFYSLSNNGRTFEKVKLMVTAQDEMDKNIFAVGFVTRKDRIMGVLYGAGPSERCNRNQIFGYWLQKRVVLSRSGAGKGLEFEAESALGPDRQLIKLPAVLPPLTSDIVSVNFEGTLTVYDDDGITPLGTQKVSLRPGTVYRIVWK